MTMTLGRSPLRRSARTSRLATPWASTSPSDGGQARQRAVGHARRVDRDDAVGAQEILGLVAQDEAVQRAREQQQAEGAQVGHGGAA